MDKPLRMNMADTRIFIEKLLQFCLETRGMQWQPTAIYRQIEDPNMLFIETIGNAVMNTFIEFQSKVQEHREVVWNYISHLPVPVTFGHLQLKVYEVSFEIYRSDNAIESTYIFLAVMVDVAMECVFEECPELIDDLVRVMPYVLNCRLPNGFIPDFDNFLKYAHNHSQHPATKCNLEM